MMRQEFLDYVSKLPVTKRGCRLWDKRLTCGYPQVHVDGYNSSRGHRTMLEIKLGRKIKPGLFSCHECDTKRCISAEHLVEGNQRKNIRDCSMRGRISRGEHRWCAKLTVKEVKIIRRAYASGEGNQPSLGKRFGVSQHAISNIVRRNTWKHVV